MRALSLSIDVSPPKNPSNPIPFQNSIQTLAQLSSSLPFATQDHSNVGGWTTEQLEENQSYSTYLDDLTKEEHGMLCSEDEGCNKRGFLLKKFNMDGLIQNRSFSSSKPNDNEDDILNHWATLKVMGGEYYGAKGTLNVYALPEVGADQGSSTLIWVVNGLRSSRDNFNVIKAGWHVYPKLYGDHNTHFFVSWTADAEYNTGCYNLLCKGFVLDKSSNYTPGAIIRPLSAYNGEQLFITLKISKDPQTGDWWLHVGPNGDKPVGYWPKSLFTSLADTADTIEWGGVVGFPKNQRSPPMGSGHFPSEGYGRAASLKNIQLVSKHGELYNPNYILYQEKTECYQISGKSAESLLFGGPGGCTD